MCKSKRKKVALVTGASKGVGKGAAEGLAEAGYKVYLTGRSSSDREPPEPLTIEATAQSVDRFGGDGVPIRVDHNDDQQVQKLVAQIQIEESEQTWQNKECQRQKGQQNAQGQRREQESGQGKGKYQCA